MNQYESDGWMRYSTPNGAKKTTFQGEVELTSLFRA